MPEYARLSVPVPGHGKPVLRRGRRTAVLAAASALLAGGCGGGDMAEQPASVEQLASAVGCAPKITMEVDDYRQGMCKTPEGQYAFVSFTTEKDKRAWLDYAQMFGGAYLVGNRWVLSVKPKEAIETARDKLGGTVEETGSSGS